MTILEDRIEIDMADENTKRLDEWFEALERLPVPEGYKVEIVGGNGQVHRPHRAQGRRLPV
nr:hypothetical protein [Streptomyces sp. 303MFCol5.2]